MTAFAEIQQLLQRYFDLLYSCDMRLFDEVFHPGAVYATADETPLLQRDMATYRDVLSKRESGAARGDNRHDVIDAIEFAGDNTAFARVRCSIGQRHFVDLLSMVRTNGRWQIISKIFHIEKNKDE